MSNAIELLAEHFSGAEVAHNSICLQLGGVHAKMAQRYFDLREKLGIHGYASKDEAIAALTAAFKVQA